jgi:hypothetical protein
MSGKTPRQKWPVVADFRAKGRFCCRRPVWLATAEDVVLHKLYWNRITPSDRQLGDVAGVMEVQRGKLDEDYLRHWAGQLGVAPELAAALSGSLKPKET